MMVDDGSGGWAHAAAIRGCHMTHLDLERRAAELALVPDGAKVLSCPLRVKREACSVREPRGGSAEHTPR